MSRYSRIIAFNTTTKVIPRERKANAILLKVK